MQDLQTAMRESYATHPAFRFEQDSWVVSDELIDAFDEAYRQARDAGSGLPRTESQALLQRCHDALAAIFDEFRRQSDDEYEVAFANELQAAVRHILDYEWNWYSRQTAAGSVAPVSPSARQQFADLQEDRHYFGRLSPEAAAKIQKLSARHVERFRANAANGKVTRQDLSTGAAADIAAICDVLNREFKRLGVLDAVSAYSGRKLRVTGLALELSVPQATWWKNAIPGLERPANTLYMHLDEAITHPKSIVYVSDVTEQNGPTSASPRVYDELALEPLQELIGRVVGTVGNAEGSPLKAYYAKTYHQSSSSEQFRRHFMRLPERLRFNSHIGWDVNPGSEFEGDFESVERQMTGPAGTYLIFDGARLFHRGGLMQSGERVALQVIFGTAANARLLWPKRVIGTLLGRRH